MGQECNYPFLESVFQSSLQLYALGLTRMGCWELSLIGLPLYQSGVVNRRGRAEDWVGHGLAHTHDDGAWQKDGRCLSPVREEILELPKGTS